MDDVRVHPYWQRGDLEGYIAEAQRVLQSKSGARPIRGVATRWFNVPTVMTQTSGDLPGALSLTDHRFPDMQHFRRRGLNELQTAAISEPIPEVSRSTMSNSKRRTDSCTDLCSRERLAFNSLARCCRSNPFSAVQGRQSTAELLVEPADLSMCRPMLLEKPQSLAYDFAGGILTARADHCGHKSFELRGQREIHHCTSNLNHRLR